MYSVKSKQYNRKVQLIKSQISEKLLIPWIRTLLDTHFSKLNNSFNFRELLILFFLLYTIQKLVLLFLFTKYH